MLIQQKSPVLRVPVVMAPRVVVSRQDSGLCRDPDSVQNVDPMTPAEVVQAQVDAYNQRDLERFLACYSDAIAVYRMPAIEPTMLGKTLLRGVLRDAALQPSRIARGDPELAS